MPDDLSEFRHACERKMQMCSPALLVKLIAESVDHMNENTGFTLLQDTKKKLGVIQAYIDERIELVADNYLADLERKLFVKMGLEYTEAEGRAEENMVQRRRKEFAALAQACLEVIDKNGALDEEQRAVMMEVASMLGTNHAAAELCLQTIDKFGPKQGQ
jgi:hypothetical protein